MVSSAAIRLQARLAVALLGALLVAAAVAQAARAAARAVTWHPTVVSIEFDDGIEDQYAARAMLARDHMHGTFFVNSGTLDSGPTYMTWSQVADLARDGNQIADHGVLHVGLAHLSTLEQAREVCGDRANLFAHGYRSTDFAYPYGSHTQTTESIVKNCGYDSGRQVGGLDSPGCCVEAEDIPPPDPYSTRSVVLSAQDTLASMMRYVTVAATKQGGWVQLVFHQLCSGCNVYGVSPALLGKLLDWLATLRSNGVVVKTVHEVLGGPVLPLVAGPQPPPVLNSANMLQNASVETLATGADTPACFQPRQWGDNVESFARTSDAHSGSYAARLDITKLTDGAARLTVTQDLGECSPSVDSGHRYVVGTWYKSTSPVYFVSYYRRTNGVWIEWVPSARFPASSGWSHAVWVTPAVPQGANGFSFGLTLDRVGSLTTDDYSLRNAAQHAAAASAPWGPIGGGIGAAVALAVGAWALRSVRRRAAPVAEPPADVGEAPAEP